jgi:predicted Zn-dependent protease with MMP-like domain
MVLILFRNPQSEIRNSMKLSEQDFTALVKKAIDRLPAEIADHLTEVTIKVMVKPSPAQIADMGYGPEEPLLGMYDGVPLPERSVFDGVRYPDIVYIFQEPHEEMCESLDELEEEIEITVAHEIGHYVGMSEERLEELGYG